MKLIRLVSTGKLRTSWRMRGMIQSVQQAESTLSYIFSLGDSFLNQANEEPPVPKESKLFNSIIHSSLNFKLTTTWIVIAFAISPFIFAADITFPLVGGLFNLYY